MTGEEQGLSSFKLIDDQGFQQLSQIQMNPMEQVISAITMKFDGNDDTEYFVLGEFGSYSCNFCALIPKLLLRSWCGCGCRDSSCQA